MNFIGAMDFFTSPDGIICLLVGAITGGAVTQFMKGWGFGWVGNIVTGAVGAVISGYIFDTLDIMNVGDYADPIIVGLLGAVILLGIAGVIRR